MIHLISRSAICWTTLPLALIRQPPSPIGTAISILSLSVAEPANPFHSPGAVPRGCVPLVRLHPARLLPVPLASQLGSGTLCAASYLFPPPDSDPFPTATRTPQPSRLLHFVRLPAPNRRHFPSQFTTRPPIFRYHSPLRHHEHDRRGTRSRLEAQWPSSAIVGAP